MRIWFMIVVLVSCLVGFAASYGYAYKQVTGVFHSSSNTVSTQIVGQR